MGEQPDQLSLFTVLNKLPLWGKATWAFMAGGVTTLFIGFLLKNPAVEWVGLGLFGAGFLITLLVGFLAKRPLSDGAAALFGSTLLSPMLSGILCAFVALLAVIVGLAGTLLGHESNWLNGFHYIGVLFCCGIIFAVSTFMKMPIGDGESDPRN